MIDTSKIEKMIKTYDMPIVHAPLPLLHAIEKLVGQVKAQNAYIEALEKQPVRSKSVIRRLRSQCGVEEGDGTS